MHSGENENEYTLTFSVRLRAGENYWETAICTKDAVTKDGLGLPGHHHRGAKRVSAKTVYPG